MLVFQMLTHKPHQTWENDNDEINSFIFKIVLSGIKFDIVFLQIYNFLNPESSTQ